MKILFVLYYYFPYVSGVSNCVKNLAEGLADKGFEVAIVTSQHQKNLPKRELINGVRIKRVPYLFKLDKGIFMPSFIWVIRQLSLEYDVVSVHLPLSEAGLLPFFINDSKIVIIYHCDVRLGRNFLSQLVEKISYFSMKAAIKRSKIVVAHSSEYALNSKVLSDFYPKIRQIYPLINVGKFKKKEPGKLRSTFGLKGNHEAIGFVGRIVYEKGLSYLVKAMDLIKRERPNSLLLLVGEYEKVAGGSIKKDLEEKVGLRKDVIFVGSLPDEDLVSFYNLCDVIVLPSIDPLEAFGMVQVEAMLCGTPVVSTDLPGVREAVLKTGMGINVPPRNEEKLAQAVVEILKNKGIYQKKRDTIIEGLKLDNILDQYVEVFKEVANG